MLRSLSTLLALALLLTVTRAEDVPKTVTAEQFFKGGQVEGFKARRITIRYDLSKESALDDFAEANPFLATPAGGFSIADGSLRAMGTGALVHKGVFETDLGVEVTLTAKEPNDVGVVLVEPGVTDKFLLFALADTYFSTEDNQPTHQHMITIVGAEDAPTGGGTEFRYLNRTMKPALPTEKPIEIQVLKKGKRNRFYFHKTTMDAEDRYGSFTELQPALYVLRSQMTVTALTITGKLSENWLTKQGIAFDPKEKDDQATKKFKSPRGRYVPAPKSGDRGGGGGRRGGDRSGWPRGGRSGALGLVGKIRDAGSPEKDRAAAAKGLTKENVRLDELRALIDCLYSEDLLTRTLAIQVLKNVTGKTLGYHPKAPEKQRKKAIRNWGRYLIENRDKYR